MASASWLGPETRVAAIALSEAYRCTVRLHHGFGGDQDSGDRGRHDRIRHDDYGLTGFGDEASLGGGFVRRPARNVSEDVKREDAPECVLDRCCSVERVVVDFDDRAR